MDFDVVFFPVFYPQRLGHNFVVLVLISVSPRCRKMFVCLRCCVCRAGIPFASITLRSLNGSFLLSSSVLFFSSLFEISLSNSVLLYSLLLRNKRS